MFRQRDYPREIVVGDGVWSVRFVRALGSTKTTYETGLCDPGEHTIFIRQKLSAEERLSTFVHEVIHAIEDEYQIAIPHHLVHSLDGPLARFIIDNYLGGK